MNRSQHNLWPRRIVHALLVVGIAAGCLAAPQALPQVHARGLAASLRASGQVKGLVVQPLTSSDAGQQSVTPAITDATIADLVRLGVKTVRLDFWTNPFGACVEGSCRTPAGQHLFDVYDPLVSKLEGAGLHIIGLLGPGFVRGDFTENAIERGGSTGDNAAVHHYAAEAGLVAAHYQSIKLWELWNEPNTQTYWLYASVYAQLAHLATQYIQSVNPGAQTIGGGLFTHGSGAHPSEGDAAVGYLKQVYSFASVAHWSRTPWDFLGVHIYVCAGPGDCPRPIDVRIATRAILNALYPVGHRFRMDITEFGTEAGGHDETSAYQASTIAAMATVFAQFGSRIDAACVYKYQDSSGDKSFGLIGADGHHRPSFDTYAGLSL